MVSCDVACHVMSLWSRHLMRCDFLCCVMSGDAMRCHGDELLSVVPCNGMECYELKMPFVVAIGCEVTLCGSKWFCDDVVIQSIFLHYKVLLQYYSSTSPVLQSTIPVLLGTTKYYASTTPVLLCTTLYYEFYKVLLQYYYKFYKVLLQYYKVLFQYYSVLQSTVPVLFLYHKVLFRHYSVLKITTFRSPAIYPNFTKYCACHEK